MHGADGGTPLALAFGQADAALQALEQHVAGDAPALEATVDAAIDITRSLLTACIAGMPGKAEPPADADLLELFRQLVKGDPTWTAIRDNLRELVYYRNCLALHRADALPAAPHKMAVRTARHVYLYLRTRCIRDRRLAETSPAA